MRLKRKPISKYFDIGFKDCYTALMQTSERSLIKTQSHLGGLSALLKAAGDELRLGVLQVLAHDSYGVLELAQVFGVKQSGISHHLKVLANAGLVSTRREGNSIFYRRAHVATNDALAITKNAIFTQADSLAMPAELQGALANIWQVRSQTSHQFFLENANKFKAQQDLIASYDVYGQQVVELLKLTPFKHRNNALEVGPGEGEFLTPLSEHFKHVVALDNSPQMLANAQRNACTLHNIKFILGDTQALSTHTQTSEPDTTATFDCAILNMVLHHTPSPAQVLADVSQALNPQGALIITELCSHPQSWARDACGDVWLGFEPTDLSRWAQVAGLSPGQSTYFALRNGFQIQIQQFFKL